MRQEPHCQVPKTENGKLIFNSAFCIVNSEFYIYDLSNGIHCIHRQTKSGVARCAIMINAGTRDERKGEEGIAHFTEHGFFKGTEHRKAYQVNCRLENLGGELNAFTSKEDTTVHATVLRGDFTKAVELLADVVFHSTFPDKELDKEREVILDEINTYRDSPNDDIYDTFEDLIFAGSELGHNILGTPRSLKGIDSAAIHRFRQRTHTTDKMVFASIGNISPNRIKEIAERYLGCYAPTKREFERIAPVVVAPFEKVLNKRTHQAHCIIGARAYNLADKRRLPYALLTNILGGPCANSRLNVSVRERNGLTYNIGASYSSLSDCGLASIYFSSDHENSDRCREIINKEIKRLQESALTARQLSMAKRQFIAQLAIINEGAEGYMMGVGKSLLAYGEVDTLEESYRKINAVTASEIMEVANEVWREPSVLLYK